MQEYIHKVQYYETDKMGIAHHSNYIRWMEEARVAFLERIGWSFARLEESGLVSPVTEVSCKYKTPCTFADVITIKIYIESLGAVRTRFRYIMKKGDATVCECSSEHCFLDKQGKIVNLSKTCPEFFSELQKHTND